MKLAIAVDVNSRDEYLKTAEQFAGLPVVLKVGLRNLPQLSISDFHNLKKAGFGLFIDTKLHDIPSQVGGAVRTWSEIGADYLTLHLSGAQAMLEEAAKSASKNMRILGVSVLTSLSENDLQAIGVAARESAAQVLKLAQLGFESGVPSFVCSLHEVSKIRALAEELKAAKPFFCCPGLVFKGESGHADQKRSATIEDAVAQKIDLLVVGRSILKSSNPRAQAEKILDLIER